MPKFLVDENLSPKISSHHHIVVTRDLGFGQVYPLYQPNLGVVLIRGKSNKTEVLVEIIDRLNTEKVLSSSKIETSLVIATPVKTRIV